jgi:class 3 adenylate cyclase
VTCPVCGSVQQATAAFCSNCGTALQRDVRRAEPAAGGEERRVVTVLFADLAGSTALGERLDPEDVCTLQSELFELVNTEVERFGGVTEKFAGDAVMAVFGVPKVHEDDAERGVRAALAASEAFGGFAARVRERHGTDVGLRIGVNTGEVVSARDAAARGELMVSGDAVNVAARLQQHASSGEVVVGERTYSSTRRVIDYRPRDAAELKGKSEPVAAWTALALAAAPVRRGVEWLSAPLIGRDDELAVLAALAARVERERAPQLVTLFGQAGIGKSRLLTEFAAQHAHARGLKGRCLPYGDGITYWPLAEAAKEHAGILDTDSHDVAETKLRAAVGAVVSREHAASVAEAVAWTIGWSLPGERGAVADTTQVRAWLLDAWSRFIGALGRERFTILAVEDIHWAS